MKRLFLSLAISVVFALFAPPVFAAIPAPITVKNADGTYTTAGKDPSFANRQVTLLVYKGSEITQAGIEYNDHVLAGTDGSYSFSNYQPIENATLATGSFHVLVGCEGMSEPVTAGEIYQTEGGNIRLKGIGLSSCSLIGRFDNAVHSYFIRVPYGTITVPVISAEPEVPTTTVSIIQAATFAAGSNTATVKVTSEDGTEAEYTFTLRQDASGTPADPILIETPYDLDSMRNGLDKYYKLINDIDLSGYTDFEPVGTSGLPFTGGLDGNGFTISNLTINSSANDVGLFGYTGSTARITGVAMNNVNITGSYFDTAGSSNVGGLAGTNCGTITLCSVSGSVSGSDKAGGLVGLGSGSISRSFSTAAVTYIWVWNVDAEIGGFVGQSCGAISDCYATGEVLYEELLTPKRSGGFAGDVINGLDLINCYTPSRSFGECLQYIPDPKATCYYLSEMNPGIFYLTTALTSEQMRNPSSFTDWDFDNIWTISGDVNEGYPTLREGSRTELSGIYLDAGSLNEPLAFSTNAYTVTLPNDTAAVPGVSAAAIYPSTTVAVTQASGFLNGSNTAVIKVTADNGDSAEYTVTFQREGDDNCELSGISLDIGSLNEEFYADITAYTVTLPVNTLKVPTVSATAQYASSAIVYTQASGFDSDKNAAEIKVTAKNGDSKTYRVTFNIRIPDSNADLASVIIGIQYPDRMVSYSLYEFDPSRTAYEYYENPFYPSFPVVFAYPASSTATVHITQATEYTTKGKNVAAITVTAEDGTVKVYTVTFKRGGEDIADLEAIKVPYQMYNGEFISGWAIYAANEPDRVIPTELTVPLDSASPGIPAIEVFFTVANPNATAEIVNATDFEPGLNVATVTVTALDGVTKKVYTLTFIRNPEDNANLSSITLSQGTINEPLSPTTRTYSVTVPFNSSYSAPAITAAAEASGATVEVINPEDFAYNKSVSIGQIIVTAANGRTRTYDIYFFLAPPGPEDLSIIGSDTLKPAKTEQDYYVNFGSSAVGGIAPFTWFAENLPDGLTMSAAGELSGIPETEGTYSVDVRVIDNAGFSKIRTFDLTVEQGPSTNSPPSRRSGVPAAAAASVTVNTVYTLDLDAIFYDADEDTLTYKVSVDGAAETEAYAVYSYIPTSAGTTTLVFRANDGKKDSADTYTLTLTAVEAAPLALTVDKTELITVSVGGYTLLSFTPAEASGGRYLLTVNSSQGGWLELYPFSGGGYDRKTPDADGRIQLQHTLTGGVTYRFMLFSSNSGSVSVSISRAAPGLSSDEMIGLHGGIFAAMYDTAGKMLSFIVLPDGVLAISDIPAGSETVKLFCLDSAWKPLCDIESFNKTAWLS